MAASAQKTSQIQSLRNQSDMFSRTYNQQMALYDTTLKQYNRKVEQLNKAKHVCEDCRAVVSTNTSFVNNLRDYARHLDNCLEANGDIMCAIERLCSGNETNANSALDAAKKLRESLQAEVNALYVLYTQYYNAAQTALRQKNAAYSQIQSLLKTR